ncbi:MAG: hypothetical protein Q8P57_03705 [Candidatus Pacearchaeota archaeon]|nr:hypothetical protein [Candidatus Pacearchaeota archaeon]
MVKRNERKKKKIREIKSRIKELRVLKPENKENEESELEREVHERDTSDFVQVLRGKGIVRAPTPILGQEEAEQESSNIRILPARTRETENNEGPRQPYIASNSATYQAGNTYQMGYHPESSTQTEELNVTPDGVRMESKARRLPALDNPIGTSQRSGLAEHGGQRDYAGEKERPQGVKKGRFSGEFVNGN